MGYADSMNLYQAFGQSPQNFRDPMGLFADEQMRQAFKIKKAKGLEDALWWVTKNVSVADERERLRLALQWSSEDSDKIYGGTSALDVAGDVLDEFMYQSSTPFLLFGKGVLEDKPQYVAASAGMMAGEALAGYGIGKFLEWAPGAITRWLTKKAKVDLPGTGLKPSLASPKADPRFSWSGHANAAAAEGDLALSVQSIPDEVVVSWGDKIGTHGADAVSVNTRTGVPTLWDAKYRGSAIIIRPTETFASPARLQNAVDKAIADLSSNATLPPSIREAAIRNLRLGNFNTRTAGFGLAKNSVLR
jgi:hypothetical protein